MIIAFHFLLSFQAHELAGITGSEVLLLITMGDSVQSYTTPKLADVVAEQAGKFLIIKCLYDAKKVTPSSSATVSSGWIIAFFYIMAENIEKDAVQRRQHSFEGITFLRDEDERHAALTSRFQKLRQKVSFE